MIKLNEKYNPDTFAAFLRDLLPEDFEEKEQDIADTSKCKVIKQAREIGHCPSLEVTVLEMQHDKETDPRVAIATDAFKLLALYGIDKALVVFNNKESDNYRFSYLTIKLDLDEKNKVKKTYSNARRYSFFLGTGAKVKTPEQQLIKKGRVKDVDDLLSRFSLEVVNKQFYLEVAKHFDELVKTEEYFLELPFQSDPNVRKNFAMRLVGRLMFCWFLKQKRSEQGQLIPDEILSTSAVTDNYYHTTLEPLFFEVLNTQIDSRDVRNDLYDKVPYLNGGLFSPQSDDYYELDRTAFVSRHINTLKVSDNWFKDFFELLETYNFTIDENTVFDQELSVDPEMLGRIFENLLAEINPETGSSERKRTGSFYTPRQIVEYMVDQSLLEYLKTKTGIEEEKLQALISYDLDDDSRHPRSEEEDKKIVDAIETLKVLDPACGSGAFPIGMLQKIVWILQNVDPDCKLWLDKKLAGVPDLYRQKIINEVRSNPFDYTRKLDVIKNSIFGVDIQPIAVEISRLRCFLTLVVESEIQDAKQNRGIEPLPNLDFKFVCANTLTGLPKPEEKGLFEDHSGIEELSSIMSEYFSCSNQRKAEIRLRFTNTQKEILNKSLRQFGGAAGDLTVKLTLWDPFSNKSNPWFDPEWMFGIEEKFDVVIGNPPYVQLSADSIDQAYKKYLLSRYESSMGRLNTFGFFTRNAIELLIDGGIQAFIIPNTILTQEYYEQLRNYLLDNTHVVQIVDILTLPFETAVVENIVLITAKNKKPTDTKVVSYDGHEFSTVSLLPQSSFRQQVNSNFNIRNHDPAVSILLEKIRDNSVELDTMFNINQAIALKGSRDKWVYKDNRGQFKKVLVGGKNINRYMISWGGEYLNYTPEAIHSCKRTDIFEADEKILFRRVANKLIAALDTARYYALHTLVVITPKPNASISLRVLLAFFNSKLWSFYYQKMYLSTKTVFTEVGAKKIGKMPVKLLDTKQASRLEHLVESISQAVQQKDEERTSAFSADIDESVMEIYGLTEEEKEIVRNS